jgi:hypothetical protein
VLDPSTKSPTPTPHGTLASIARWFSTHVPPLSYSFRMEPPDEASPELGWQIFVTHPFERRYYRMRTDATTQEWVDLIFRAARPQDIMNSEVPRWVWLLAGAILVFELLIYRPKWLW